MSNNIAPSAQENKAGLSVGNDKHWMMGRVTFMTSGESDEKSFLAGYDKGLNAGWALGFHEAYEVLSKRGRPQARREQEKDGSGHTVAATENGGGTEKPVASTASVGESNQLGSGCEQGSLKPLIDTAAHAEPANRYWAKPNPTGRPSERQDNNLFAETETGNHGKHRFSTAVEDFIDLQDSNLHENESTTSGGFEATGVSSGSRFSDQGIITALDSIVNSAPMLDVFLKDEPATIPAKTVSNASIVTSAPMEDVFYNPEPIVTKTETTTSNPKEHTPAGPTLKRRKAFPVINHTTPVSSPETSPPLRCIDKPNYPKLNSYNKSITIGKWSLTTPTSEKPADSATKPTTLYNIPLPHTISPVAPSGLHDPALCARTRPKYPELADPYNVYALQRAGRTFGENPYRVLIGPLGAASRDAWTEDCGRAYLSVKLAAADAREKAREREEKKKMDGKDGEGGGGGGGAGGRDEGPPNSGIEFVQMVSDPRHKVWYVLAMFESPAKADAAIKFFKDGYACGGSIMWAWTFLEN